MSNSTSTELATTQVREGSTEATHLSAHNVKERLVRRRKVASVIVALVAVLFPVAPIIWMLSSSFKINPEIFARPPALITENFSFDAYVTLLTDPEKLRIFGNSYLVATVVTLLSVLVAIHAAYAFSRFDFPGRRIINVIVISVQAVPPITLLIPYFGLIVALGMHNSYQGLIFTYMVFTLPYAIIMLTGYFNTIPRELDEAVKVDGGSAFTALWKVIIPVSVPALVSVGVYTFIIAWNEYLFALTLTNSTDMRTVPIGISLLMGQHSYNWNEIMAMSVIGSIPVVILFTFFQRYFIGGMTAGAVKA